MYLFTDLFWDKIKKDRKIKKAIYLDEVWRLIGVTSNKDVASFIYKIFKTIRKFGGSSIAITQDISDLFSLENGIYGKSIINNSSNKVFFSLEEESTFPDVLSDEPSTPVVFPQAVKPAIIAAAVNAAIIFLQFIIDSFP